MTRYAIRTIPGETQPCAVADPAGCFYSTGEVDRLMVPRTELDSLRKQIEKLKQPISDCPFCRGTGISELYNDADGWCRFCDGSGMEDEEEAPYDKGTSEAMSTGDSCFEAGNIQA